MAWLRLSKDRTAPFDMQVIIAAILYWIGYLYAIELAQNRTSGSGRLTDEPAVHANSFLSRLCLRDA